jgi:hypothetical protein
MSTDKTSFNWITDTNSKINVHCTDFTPPFLNYIPAGTPVQSVDIENELRGSSRYNTRCASCKYQQEEYKLKLQVQPNGYIITKQ